ncbi:MAG: hypothetical protein ACI8P0_004199 [Planctomycetaceae bacterium]|jgi:hypothetical protein
MAARGAVIWEIAEPADVSFHLSVRGPASYRQPPFVVACKADLLLTLVHETTNGYRPKTASLQGWRMKSNG